MESLLVSQARLPTKCNLNPFNIAFCVVAVLFCCFIRNQPEAYAEAIIVDSLESTFRSFSLDYNHFATLSR